MSCLDIILPGSLINASNLPLAYNDQLISAGTLMLWEPGHPLAPFSGVPTQPVANTGAPGATTTAMPNVAQVSAQNLLGGSSVNVSPTFYRNDGTGAPAPDKDMFIERSALGGLHVVTSQSTEGTGRQASLQLPASVQSYIIANPNHVYYLSAWYRITRVALAGMTMPYVYIGANAGVGNMLFDEGITGHLGSSTIKGSSISPAKNTLGNTFEAWNNNFQGTPPSGTSSMIAVPFGFGQVASQYGDAARNVDFSAILYRVFLEDLTVSGRTFAAVSALDQSLYNAAFTSGGRYNGDTYTSPSTLP